MILVLFWGKMTIWNFKHYRRKYRLLITQIILLKWEQKKSKVCIYLITLIACRKYMDNIVHINKTPSYIKDTAKNVLFSLPQFWLYNTFAWKIFFYWFSETSISKRDCYLIWFKFEAYYFVLNGLLSKFKIKAILLLLEGVKEVIWFNEEQIISNKMFSRLFLLCFQ